MQEKEKRDEMQPEKEKRDGMQKDTERVSASACAGDAVRTCDAGERSAMSCCGAGESGAMDCCEAGESGAMSCCDAGESGAMDCCGARKKLRSGEEKAAMIRRLRRMEGQIRGLCGMVERDAYCIDILIQTAAVGAALNAFRRELLGNHIRTCVAEDLREGKTRTAEELIATLHKLMK